MKVYKYCESQFNPLKNKDCKTVALTNHRVFRDNYQGEGDFINDRNEGISNGYDLNGNVFIQSKFSPDGLLYCTSTKKLDYDYVKNNFSEKYDSCYSIKDINAFSSRILDYAATKLAPESIHNTHYPEIQSFIDRNKITHEKFMAHLSVQLYADKVRYDRFGRLVIADIRNPVGQILASNFNKLPAYENQSEYRSVFVLLQHLDSSFLHFAPDRMIVEIPDILDYIEEC